MYPDYENEADGHYILSTYSISKSFEILARYDRYNRMTNDNTLYRIFETTTTGFSYIFKNYNRIDVNYAINSIEAPYDDTVDSFLDSTVGNVLSIQLTWVFR